VAYRPDTHSVNPAGEPDPKLVELTELLVGDTLRARYMDTMGDEATYTWVLDHREIRVSLGDEDAITYVRATLNGDNSEYVGTWHYPAGGPPDSAERIVYTRVRDDARSDRSRG
jgi:hypothetical protein